MTVEYKNVSSDFKVVDRKDGLVQALVSTTNIVDHGKDKILPGAYAQTLRERTPKVCWAHSWEHPIGKCLQAKEYLPGNSQLPTRHKAMNAGSLWTLNQLNLKVQAGRDALEWLMFWKEDHPDAELTTDAPWSIGYDASGTTTDGKQKAYRDTKSGIRTIRALNLMEISPVLHGMADLTDTLSVKDLPRPVRILTQAVKAMQDGTLSPLAELSLDELAGAIDLKDYSRKAKMPNNELSDDVDAVHKHSAEIEAEPEPDNRSGETAKAGGDATTKIEEDSYDDGTPQKPAKPGWEDEDDDDGRAGGGREDVDAEDKSRHSVQTWVSMFGGKDWATWDQEHPESAAGDEEPGEEEQKPSSGAPKPSSGAPKPSSDAPKSPAGGTADAVDDTAPKPSEGGEKPDGEGEAGKLAEGLSHVVETVRDTIHEGRERGDRWAEQWSSASSSNQGKTIRTISLGSHEETKAATDLTSQTHQDEIDEERDEQHTEESGRETPPVEKAFGDWKLRKPNIPLPTDSDGYVEDDDGIAGDASRRVDAPQDAALPVELSKRGIPDEDGRTDASAMKTRFQSKRDFDANVGGGVDRDKLSAGDFVFPKTRTFPIVTAGDVSDAVSSWGRYKGSESFDTFKARLTSIAKRKGFAGSLPDEWKAGGEKVYDDSVSTKAWVNLEGSYEDTKADLSEAVDRMIDSVFPDMDVTSWVVATYPTKAIVGLVHNGGPGDMTPEFWEVPYNIDNKDVVTLSSPKSLDVVGVAVDRQQSDSVFNFVPAAAVAVKGLQEKNQTRLNRRYALLANLGVDVTAGHPGLTPALLRMAPEGLSYIPQEGDSDFRTGQMDMSQPGGAEPNIPDNGAVTARGVSADPGNLSAPEFPSFYQGTYYVDNAGNLTASPVASDINSGVGMRPSPVDSSLYSGHHYGDQVPPAMNGILGTTLDAGTLSYRGMRPGEAKNESRIQRHRRLLELFNARVPDADEPLSDSTETEEKLLSLVTTISEAFTEVKEGRMLSAANAGHLSDAHEAMGHMLAGHAKLAEAHSAMGELLRQAGVEPSVFEPQNEEGGKDEEGVPIEPVEAKSFLEDIAQWKALQEGTTV